MSGEGSVEYKLIGRERMGGGGNLKLTGRQKIFEKVQGFSDRRKNESTSLYLVEKNRE